MDLISSEALEDEARRNPSMERRLEAETFLSLAVTTVEIDDTVARRAQRLAGLGYGPFDALHIAAAESASVDVLLSTDDRLIKRAARGLGNPRIPVRNPVSLDQGARIMIAIDQLTDEQFERHALDVLKRELGADGLARFLRLNRSGPGDYTRDRDEWQKDLTLDQILQSIRAHRTARSQ